MGILDQLQRTAINNATGIARNETNQVLRRPPVRDEHIPRAASTRDYGEQNHARAKTPPMNRPSQDRNETSSHYLGELRAYNNNLSQRLKENHDPAAQKALGREKSLTDGEIRKVSEQAKREHQQQNRPGVVEQVGKEVRRQGGNIAQREINNALRGLLR